MTPNQALQLYVALKLHFSGSYDFHKYGGRLKRPVNYSKRNDKFQLEKLARHPAPMNLVLSNLLSNADAWVGDIVSIEGIKRYKEWQKRNESLTYEFRTNLDRLPRNLTEILRVTDANHPELLVRYLRNDLCIEFVCILDRIVSFGDKWNQTPLKEDFIWKNLQLLIKKYTPFIQFEKEKFAKILYEYFR